jgi:CRP-like cAMP-binding protein
MTHKLRQHIEQVVALTDEEFSYILSHFTSRKLKKHQYLIQPGESVSHTYFVVSGLLKLVHTDANGKDHIMQFALEDWWVSDELAYFTRAKATMSLDCLEDTEVLCLSLEDNEKLLASVQKMEHFFLKKANFGYIGAQRRILSLLTSSAQERYEQLLKQYPSLITRVPKTLLASYLGVSRETLSRLSR